MRAIPLRIRAARAHMLRVYTDEGLEQESWFAGVALQDLNRLLIRPDLYSPAIFPELTLTGIEKHVVEHRENVGDSQYQALIFVKVAFNRELLERVFPGDVPERKRKEWNNTQYLNISVYRRYLAACWYGIVVASLDDYLPSERFGDVS